MAYVDLKILYTRAEFLLLPALQDIKRDLFRAFISTKTWGTPIVGLEVIPDGLVVQWAAVPSDADRLQMTTSVATFIGGNTSSAPVEVEALGVAQALLPNVATEVLDVTTPMLDEGTYDLKWACLVGMLAAVSNTSVRGVITLQRIRGADITERIYEHNSTTVALQCFGAGLTFTCMAGDKIRARLQLFKVGVSVATAQMSMARITIDRKASASS